MAKKLGVWIDHREAVIAEVDGEKVRFAFGPPERELVVELSAGCQRRNSAVSGLRCPTRTAS